MSTQRTATHGPRRRLARAALGALAGTAALVAATALAFAHAPLRWTLPTKSIFRTDMGLSPMIAPLASGGSDVAFIALGPYAQNAYLVHLRPGATHGAARTLTLPAGETEGTAATGPLAADGAGDVYAAYATTSSPPPGLQPRAVYVSIAAAGGTFGAPQLLGGAAPSTALTMAVAPDGAAVVAFKQQRADQLDAVVSTRQPGGAFLPAQVIAPIDVHAQPVLAIDPMGDFVVAWGVPLVVDTGTVGGAVRQAQTLTSASLAAVNVAIGAGRAVVSWFDDHTVGGFTGTCLAAIAPPAGSFSAAARLSSTCTDPPGPPALAVSDTGEVLAAVGANKGHSGTLQVYAAPPGEGFRRPQTVYAGFELPAAPLLGVAANGDAALAFEDLAPGSGTSEEIRASVATAGHAFGASTLLSLQPPSLELDAAAGGQGGQLYVAWQSGGADGLFIATAAGGGGSGASGAAGITGPTGPTDASGPTGPTGPPEQPR